MPSDNINPKSKANANKGTHEKTITWEGNAARNEHTEACAYHHVPEDDAKTTILFFNIDR